MPKQSRAKSARRRAFKRDNHQLAVARQQLLPPSSKEVLSVFLVSLTRIALLTIMSRLLEDVFFGEDDSFPIPQTSSVYI
jgi:hypothetical protein